ncbi:hypothetical protein YC2023_054888 [Brassica napus]
MAMSVVSGYEKELRGFEKEIEDVKMKLKSLKNMIFTINLFKFSTIVAAKADQSVISGISHVVSFVYENNGDVKFMVESAVFTANNSKINKF